MSQTRITKAEFDELVKLSKKQHYVGFCTPAVTFYWDETGSKHADLSFGQHAFLSAVETCPYTGAEAAYYKIEIDGSGTINKRGDE